MRHIRRRQFLIAAGALLAAPRVTFSQAKLPTIGLLWNDSVKPSPFQATFLRALREKGYVVGRDFQIEDRISLEGYGGMPEGAAQLVRAKVDIIVTFGATAALAAAKGTKEIPIVMVIGSDPVAAGLVKSLSHPDSNVTGLITGVILTAKRIQLLTELIPGMSRIGVLVAPGSSSYATSKRDIDDGSRTLKLEPHFAEVRVPADLDGAFASLSRSRVDAVLVQGSTMLGANRERIVALAAKHRLPAMYSGLRNVDAGGLMAYAPDMHQAFVLTATYVDRILKGATPRDLPIEQASKFELVINLRTAKALGLKIPQSILLRADRVIE